MIERVIAPRETILSGNMKVKRILPFRERRMVGPFIFLDQMGPLQLPPGHAGDVPPHPHIGLSTVTYLFEGQFFHRDSLGSRQPIFPNDVNWMTAGKGIVHSERVPDSIRSEGQRLYGLQAWVALPESAEDQEPEFDHYSKKELPLFQVGKSEIRLVAGSAFGRTSPVKTKSKLFYFEVKMPKGEVLSFDPQGADAAFYLLSGMIQTDGRIFDQPSLIVFEKGAPIQIIASEAVHGMFLGGEPLDGVRHIWWNFVSSSREKIEQAKRDWKLQNFPKVPDETEFVPLPE